MSAPSRLHWIAILLVVLAAVAVYRGVLSSPLIYDDASAVTYNPSIRSLWPPASVLLPPSECTIAGRPVTNVTLAINYRFGGTSGWGYHIVNLCFHIGAALFLLGILRRTLAIPVGPEAPGAGGLTAASPHLALAIALLWTVHPLLTGSVTYISQRTEVLMGFFYLGTLYAFIRGAYEARPAWLALSAGACFLGMGSKEGMATAPLVILLYDRAFIAGTFLTGLRRRWPYYLALAGSWILLAFLTVGLKDRAVGFGLGVSWFSYALTECRAILLYLRLVVWPTPLIFDYGPEFVDGLAAGWPAATLVFFGVAGVIYMLIRHPRRGFAAAAFLLVLAPTSSIIPVSAQPIAENRTYLATAAILVYVVMGIYKSLGRRSGFIFGAMALATAGVAWQRNEVYKDALALWTDTVAKRPANARAFENLGEVLHERGRYTAAREQFETAVRLKPTYPEAHNSLGSTLAQLGDGQGAKRHLETALTLKPDYATAHNNLGNVLLQLGEIDGARRHCEEALRLLLQKGRLRMDLPQTYNNLGNALLYQGKIAEAKGHYEEAVRLDPDFGQAQMNLGVALRVLGETERARVHLKKALSLRPDSPEARFNLAVLFQQIGQTNDAVKYFEAALAVRPQFPEAYINLGQLRLREGNFVEAKTDFEAALQLRPGDQAARLGLDQVLAAQRQRETTKAPR